MLFHRRRERFKFTEKKHSKLGIAVFAIALVLVVLYGVFVLLAFRGDGGLSAYFGSVGVFALVASLCCVGFAGKSLREEDSFMLFPRLALVASVLAVVCWLGTYVMGFVM